MAVNKINIVAVIDPRLKRLLDALLELDVERSAEVRGLFVDIVGDPADLISVAADDCVTPGTSDLRVFLNLSQRGLDFVAAAAGYIDLDSVEHIAHSRTSEDS